MRQRQEKTRIDTSAGTRLDYRGHGWERQTWTAAGGFALIALNGETRLRPLSMEGGISR